MSEVLARINTPSAELEQRIGELSARHNIGSVYSWSVIEGGLEDCNIKIESEKGRFLLKVFAINREPNDVERYIEIVTTVSKAKGITVQNVHPARDGVLAPYLNSEKQTDRYMLLSWLEGKSFYETGTLPSDGQLVNLLRQVVMLEQLDFQPVYSFDSWAISNIKNMFESVQQYLSDDELALANEAVELYESVNHDNLPHVFVHGDLTKQNVIQMTDGVGLIDFSVSNWYPRIQEFAVIVANLLHDEGKTSLDEKIQRVISLSNTFIELNQDEVRALKIYSIAAMAMEFLGSCQEKFLKGGSLDEIDYWLNLGRKGLEEALRN